MAGGGRSPALPHAYHHRRNINAPTPRDGGKILLHRSGRFLDEREPLTRPHLRHLAAEFLALRYRPRRRVEDVEVQPSNLATIDYTYLSIVYIHIFYFLCIYI